MDDLWGQDSMVVDEEEGRPENDGVIDIDDSPEGRLLRVVSDMKLLSELSAEERNRRYTQRFAP